MSSSQELWQVYESNGSPITGVGIDPDESRRTPDVVVGAVHVWIWRRREGSVEILLQKRSHEKPTWPGYIDISAAGHVNLGESLLDAAVRETREEVGYDIDIGRLWHFFTYRSAKTGLKWAYLYELTEESVDFVFNDGEVEQLEWVGLEDFELMTQSPEKHGLVPHIAEYFSLLLSAIREQ